jgi:hypothetical protein
MPSTQIHQPLQKNDEGNKTTLEQKLSLYMLDRQDILHELSSFENLSGFKEMLNGIYAKSLLATWSNKLNWEDNGETMTPKAIASLKELNRLQEDFDSLLANTDSSLPLSKRCISAFSKLIQKNDFIYEAGRSDKIDSLLNKRFDCESITDLFIQLSSKNGLKSVGAVFSLELNGDITEDYMPAIFEDNKFKFFYSYYLLFNRKDSEKLNKDLQQICLFDIESIPSELTFKQLEVILDEEAQLPFQNISFTLRQRYFVLNELSHYIDGLDNKSPIQILREGEQKYLLRWKKDPYDFSFFYACANFYSLAANLSDDKYYKSKIAKSLIYLFTEGKTLYGEKMLRQSLPDYQNFLDSIFSNNLKTQ